MNRRDSPRFTRKQIEARHYPQVVSERVAKQQRRQEYARRLIDIGFKALAKELHPDKPGGNHETMSRLNQVRNRLMMEFG